MTTIGYARTRTGDDTAAIRAELTAAGCIAVHCDEQVSIRAAWPQYDRTLAAMATGDTLIVCRLVHIGRSLDHLAELLTTLDRRGIRFLALHEQLDTAEHGELLRQVAYGLIDARHAWRSEATLEGLADAAAAGQKLGRQPGPPPLTHEQNELARHLQTTGLPIAEIADLIGVSRSKLYLARPPTAPSNGEDSTP